MQERGDGEVQALRVAFEALLPFADPLRQAAILRMALRALINNNADADSPRSPAPFDEGIAAAEAVRPQPAARWPQLRGELRARLQQRYGSLARGGKELAQAISISELRAVRILCPSADPPGIKVLAALEDWLNTDASPANGGSPPEIGVSRSKKPTSKSGPPRQKPNHSHPEEASADPHRLAASLREKLAAQLELDPKAVREAGVTIDVAERAVCGQDLAPEIVARLTAFLS